MLLSFGTLKNMFDAFHVKKREKKIIHLQKIGVIFIDFLSIDDLGEYPKVTLKRDADGKRTMIIEKMKNDVNWDKYTFNEIGLIERRTHSKIYPAPKRPDGVTREGYPICIIMIQLNEVADGSYTGKIWAFD